MAQESKVMESKATESKAAEKKLYVSREVFGKSEKGENLYSYFILAKFRGREVRISLQAEEGGYDFLSIIFGESMQAEARFVLSEYKMDEKSAPIVTLGVEVFVFDESDGIEYTAPLKGQRKSDKNELLNLKKIYDLANK